MSNQIAADSPKNVVAQKIAMVVWNDFRNDARVLKEAETLQAAGYAVNVFALHTPGVTQERETLSSGIHVIRVARSPLWRLRKRKASSSGGAVAAGPINKISLWVQVLRIIARLWTHSWLMINMVRLRPVVVHAHDVNTLVTAWIAAKLSGAYIVYDAHEISTSREGYASFRGLVARVESILMPRVQGAITTTDARAKFFARMYGVARPLVLQNRPRRVYVQNSERIRQQLNLTEESWPIVLYQGGLQQGRGLSLLVKVAAQVPGAYFIFIGGGRLSSSLKSLVTELNISERVRFIPTVALADLPAYTASADIGVQPLENTCLNHFTTDSNKLFEYVAAGLPVVATDLPEIRGVVREHNLGLLFASGSEIRLTEAIRSLIDDNQLRSLYQKNSMKAAKLLTWEAQEGKLVSLYEKVLGRRVGLGEPEDLAY